MKIKKGFLGNNWVPMAAILAIIAIAIQSRDVLIGVLAVAIVLVLINKYRKYDEVEQETDDWWKGLSKDDKNKLKSKGME